jgi:hypothetical protein
LHAARHVDRVGAAHQHFLGVAAAQSASATEGPMINDSDGSPGLAHPCGRHLRGGAGANHD